MTQEDCGETVRLASEAPQGTVLIGFFLQVEAHNPAQPSALTVHFEKKIAVMFANNNDKLWRRLTMTDRPHGHHEKSKLRHQLPQERRSHGASVLPTSVLTIEGVSEKELTMRETHMNGGVLL